MQRVTRGTAVAVMPAAPASPGTPGYFTGGNPATATPATVPGFEWFNGVQEELVGLILRAGLTPAQADLAQVRQALDRLYGGGLRTLTANTTLTAADAGLVLINAASNAVTVTLPAAASLNARPIEFRFVRLDGSANAVTIQRAGAPDVIEGLTSLPVVPNGRVVLQSDGVSAWFNDGAQAPLTGIQGFVASGTFTVPASVFRLRVRLWGGGGGSAGNVAGAASAGGGAGAYAEDIVSVTPGQSITVTIGAGGSPGTSGGGAGTNGGTSSFGAFLSCPGGTAGTASVGGPGGVPSAGTYRVTGAQGSGIISALVGGYGGSAPLGGGGGIPASNTAGVSGLFPGGGASGTGGASAFAGGTGAAGYCLVEW